MKTKVFILRYSDGEYEDYSEFTDAVLVGNAKYQISDLRAEYQTYVAGIREVWKAQNVKKLKEGVHYLSFPKWLVEMKNMRELEYEEEVW